MRIIAEWREEDYKNGEKKGSIKTAKNMIKKNYPLEEIMEITELNKETILNLQ